MQRKILKYAALVFLGGASYGVMATTVKLSYAAGYSWNEAVASQAFFGFLLFVVAAGVSQLYQRTFVPLNRKQIFALLALGVNTCSTAVFYNLSLTTLPAPVALTLLFQFTWIGVVIQVITTKHTPNTPEVIAALMVMGGTCAASNLLENGIGSLDALGVVFGLMAALSCALFMHFSGHVGVKLPALQRGLMVSFGAFLLGQAVCPAYFFSGVLQQGIWQYGLVMGLSSLFIPVILFGMGTPHLPTGLSTILASSELPCGIAVAICVLGETITPLQTAGIIVILLGVCVAQFGESFQDALRRFAGRG